MYSENYVLIHSISPNMWTYSQENYSLIVSSFTETVLTFLDRAAFFTDNKNYSEISTIRELRHPRKSNPPEILPSRSVRS